MDQHKIFFLSDDYGLNMLKSKIVSKLKQKISNIFGLLNLLLIDVDADSSGFVMHNSDV